MTHGSEATVQGTAQGSIADRARDLLFAAYADEPNGSLSPPWMTSRDLPDRDGSNLHESLVDAVFSL
jgi:hypothetical protein